MKDFADVAVEDEDAHGFESAGGGACHAAAEGEDDEEEGDGDPPGGGVGDEGAGGGEDADGLHGGAAEGVGPGDVGGGAEGEADEEGGYGEGAEEEGELVELGAYAVPAEGDEVEDEHEVDAAEEHGEGDDVLLEVGEVFEAVVVDGEAAGGDVGEGDVEGVPGVHAAFPEEEDEEEGEGEIDAEGLADGGGHGGGLLARIVRARGFGGVEAVFVDAQGGHDGEDEEHDAEAAEPLRHAAPEEYGGGQPLDGGEDRGSRRGDAGHGFEEGVAEGVEGACGKEGEGAEEGKDDPEEDDEEVGVAAVGDGAGIVVAHPQQQSEEEGEEPRRRDGGGCAVGEVQGRDEAGKHEAAFNHQHDAETT